ncbi:ABC transporter substrate-binding protein [Nocardiopsis aegyptia]|uniref:Glycine betaine/proline transport system substrate-binding protein n=1 Tax=Nocardiopsis aegyptia TaxID=220378 RepID=A0A7Z0EIF2_9ACTN|nr:ABC transporter substrate-binding protein [Nocardiopsis aegyptia]NYJ32648.1 glycine betaine/proline transport system substrate-binding protein [Nocardiopsis aegyptia]
MFATACGAQGIEQDVAGGEEVLLVQQPWEDLVVENEIVRQVLEENGYEVTVQEVSVPIGAQALADGSVDAYLGNWWPSQEPVFSDHLDSGDIEVLGTLMTGTTYAPAVPAYVAEEHGVRSLADLDGNRDLFGGEFIGIEAGTPGNEYILDAIGDDAYGLGDWELVQSSSAAMLGEVERRADEQEPVVFLGWEPHWMNVQWDLVYLEDPEEVWPGAGEIRVLTRAGFESDNPDVARFLSQMEVDTATASAWINRLSKDGDPVETVAQEWIAQNTDEVEAWLDGVETADGQPAEVSGA